MKLIADESGKITHVEVTLTTEEFIALAGQWGADVYRYASDADIDTYADLREQFEERVVATWRQHLR